MAKYHEWLEKDGLLRLEAYARDGLIDKQIAEKIGIGEATFTRWKASYPEILVALKKGKEAVDIEVENSLLKRAMGYDYVEVTQERRMNKEAGEPEIVVTKRVTKHVNPDVTAQIFWLKNRKPVEWRDKQDHVISSDNLERSIKQIQSIADLVNKPTPERNLNDYIGDSDDTVCGTDKETD